MAPSARTAPAHAALAAAAGVVGIALAAWASLDGRTLVEVVPSTVPPLQTPTLSTMTPTATTATATTTTTRAASSGGTPPDWLGTLLLTLAALLLLALVAAVLVRLYRAWRPLPHPEDPTTDAPAIDVLVDAEGERLARSLQEGSPRNGIVECWHRLELLVAEAGHARRPDETSTELVTRVLDAYPVPADALAGLASLYREARFSRHELSERQRAQAADALDGIRAALRSGQVTR